MLYLKKTTAKFQYFVYLVFVYIPYLGPFTLLEIVYLSNINSA